MQNDASYLKRLGARILGEANDLKRTPEALAEDLGLPFETIQKAIAGELAEDAAVDLLRSMASVYPVSFSSLWVEPDDTDGGVRVMKRTESQASSRVFERKDRNGNFSPYYEYRDTAMSRAAPFKPEWIKELRFVDDDDPDNGDVAYNNGHLMHQQTFFIGEVNFYWKTDGKSHCAQMNTGDSNYITPFVSHSFTSRNKGAPGLIVAVTFAGQVRDALDTFSQVDGKTIEDYSGDLRDKRSIFATRLKRHLAAESLTTEAFSKWLVDEGVEVARARSLTRTEFLPSAEEIKVMAELLKIRETDLMTTEMASDEEVAVTYGERERSRSFPDDNYPAYRMKPLARVRQQPQLKGFDVTVLGGSREAVLQHTLHEYIYNYGDVAVDLSWGDSNRETLQPGDSAYLRPLTEHSFSASNGAEGRLAMVRVPGQLLDGVIDEFAAFDEVGRSRALGENKRWF
tara:strand:+ start:51 stop:1418 length:1368 start_codon:yes stop_codon:yes gene_type:complete